MILFIEKSISILLLNVVIINKENLVTNCPIENTQQSVFNFLDKDLPDSANGEILLQSKFVS
jgi:NADPH-dependent curcumin reductase CurA